MPSWAIHLNIAQKLSEKMKEEDKQSFLLGNILPDVNVGHLVNPISKKIPYSTTHCAKMLTFSNEEKELPDYEEFIKQYKQIIKEPIVLGYLTHLMTDFYWNCYTYEKKGVYENGIMVGLRGKENVIFGNDEELRKVKVSDFNVFSKHLYKNGLVPIPNFKDNLMENVEPIKQIHIEGKDLYGVNKYFENVIQKIEKEAQVYKVYSLEEMEENSKQNIEFIEKKFKELE